MKAFILAAGVGSRLRPLTDNIPKAMVEVAGKPMILHLIERLKEQGVAEFVVNLHHHSKLLHDFLENLKILDVTICFSDESDALLDTGGALKRASKYFCDGKPFLIHNVDVWTDTNPFDILKHHSEVDAITTLAVRDRKTLRKFLFNQKGHLRGRIDAQGVPQYVGAKSEKLLSFAFSGVQIVSEKIFDHFPDEDVFSLPELYMRVAAAGELVVAYDHSSDVWSDLGTVERILEHEKRVVT